MSKDKMEMSYTMKDGIPEISNLSEWLPFKDFGSCFVNGVKYVREDVQLDYRGLVSRELFGSVIVQLATHGFLGSIEDMRSYMELLIKELGSEMPAVKEALEALLDTEEKFDAIGKDNE